MPFTLFDYLQRTQKISHQNLGFMTVQFVLFLVFGFSVLTGLYRICCLLHGYLEVRFAQGFYQIFRFQWMQKLFGRLQQGEDVRIELTISLQEAVLGCEKTIELEHLNFCETCWGRGILLGHQPHACPSCLGARYRSRDRHRACSTCEGLGLTFSRPCAACEGSGQVFPPTIRVQVPAGVKPNTRLRIPGKGQLATNAYCLPGDLYIYLSILEAQTDLEWLHHCNEPEVQQAIWQYLNLPQPTALTADYQTLQRYLATAQWQAADKLTCTIILSLAGRQGSWLREEDLAKLVPADLKILDRLWRFYSGDRFGFTVQAQVWQACWQEQGSASSRAVGSISFAFAKRVGWEVNAYELHYPSESKYDFERKARIPYALTAPLGHLPSTFALGGGEKHLEYEPPDTESTMGFYGGDRYYYILSQDTFFGTDLLHHLFSIIESC
ncbi:GUN4 domain-containing protein [Leptolyngbya sp. PL-A3]|nr:GUN4 domain-containing protein [Leptolyngbya sp. FACHB-16]